MTTILCRSWALTILMAGLGSATTLTVSSLDSSRGQYSVWLKLDNVEVQEYYAGAINVTVDHTYDRTAFCIDLFTGISFSDYDTDLSLPAGNSNLQRIAWLIEKELSSVSSGAQGAGLQVAIWDIIHDSGDGLGAGRIQSATVNTTDSSIIMATDTFLNLSGGKSSQRAIVYTNSQNGVPAQRLISDTTPDSGPMPAPEAGSSALMVLGMSSLMVGAVRKKCLRRKHSA